MSWRVGIPLIWAAVAVVAVLPLESKAAAPGAGFRGSSTPINGIDRISAVTLDGSVVAGSVHAPYYDQACRWTAAEGGKPLVSDGTWPNMGGMSADGQVVVGTLGAQAFRWSVSGGMRALGDLPGGKFESCAFGTSADGSVVVGYGTSASGSEAFRWTASAGMRSLGRLKNTDTGSWAVAASADGSVVVGTSGVPAQNYWAFRWTEATGMQALTDPAGLYYSTEAEAVSSDGSVVLGFGEGRVNREAFRWTAADGMLGLGPMFQASSVSADGSVIVGRSELPGSISRGEPTPVPELFIWMEGRGTRLLTDVLVNDCGLDISGWTLWRAMLVSPDGQTIVGTGLNPDGQLDVWTATLPEPSTLALAAAGALMLIRRRRGRR